MSRIKGKDTKPEILLRKFLHATGFRYRLHNKKLPASGMGICIANNIYHTKRMNSNSYFRFLSLGY